MGNAQPSKLLDSNSVDNLSFLEDGQFAKIYKGDFGPSRQRVSIKVPRVPDNIRKDRKCVKVHIEEVKKLMPALKRPRNEHVLRVLGVSYDDFRKEVWVIREFVDGVDLETLLKNPSLCPTLRSPEKKIKVALGISKGMSHLHHGLRSVPVVHGDLELSDVLIDSNTLVPKIANFGLWDFKQYFVRNVVPEHVSGSLLNACQAPEVLLGDERPSLFSDCWSEAAVILHWMTELPPWDLNDLCQRYRLRGDRQTSALKNAMDNEEDPTVLQHLADEPDLAFLRDCFNYEATRRPSAKSIEHNLLQACQTPTWTNVAYHKYYS